MRICNAAQNNILDIEQKIMNKDKIGGRAEPSANPLPPWIQADQQAAVPDHIPSKGEIAKRDRDDRRRKFEEERS